MLRLYTEGTKNIALTVLIVNTRTVELPGCRATSGSSPSPPTLVALMTRPPISAVINGLHGQMLKLILLPAALSPGFDGMGDMNFAGNFVMTRRTITGTSYGLVIRTDTENSLPASVCG